VNRIAPAAAAAILALAAPAAASPFAARTGRYRATARFTVAYAGSGRWVTSYHAEPSDGGGKHDTDTARDSSTQKWSETLSRPLIVRACDCGSPAELTGARGTSSAAGRIDHVHLDGLYADLNASERCTVRSATPAGMPLDGEVEFAYEPRSRSMSLTALNPVGDALLLLPPECPGQGDSLDGLADSYFTPGFSFAPGWGPDRWFTSATVSIPLSVLHRASRITIPLADARGGRPPRDCSVPHPSWQRCRTSGSWSGALTLTARR
jgi:hypothetical protein